MSVRAIFGWQHPSQIKVPNPNRKCKRLPIDDEICECGDVTDVGEEPEYDIETLKLMATMAAVAKKAARKAKRSKRPIGKTDKPCDKPAKRVRTGQESAAAAQVPPVTLWAFC